MRARTAVVAALIGLVSGSAAWADPFEHLEARLQHYQEPADAGSAPTPAPKAHAAPQGGEVVPTPVPDHFAEPHPYYGHQGHPVWQDPMMVGCCDEMCNPCQRWGFWWGRAEYMVWWVRGANTPPLVTTSPDGTPVGEAGVLPGAQILFGNERINTEPVSGGRFTLGYWFDPAQTLGIEDTFFFIGNGDDSFFDSSNGSPILARPFFNTQTDQSDALVLAFPDIVAGDIDITSGRTVTSNELNLRRGLVYNCCSRFDLLLGYRFLYLGENLDIRTNTLALQGGIEEPGTTFDVEDLFSTRSEFHGVQLGVNYQRYWGCWTLDMAFKLALGGVGQRVRIDGSTVRTVDGQTGVFEGGVLALPSNIGNHKRTRFGAMPELGLNLRYQWSPLWTFSFGYTLIGLTNVVRPGDQIDLSLDPAQFPPGVPGDFPQFSFQDSDLWLQAINFGVECNF